MKALLLIPLFYVFAIVNSNAQEIQFPASILSAGGEEVSNGPSHVSKWRIGRINVLHIRSNDLKNSEITAMEEVANNPYKDWKILAYPNPVTEILKVKFEITNPAFLEINVTDITGRKIIERKIQQIVPNETIELDLKGLNSALYFVNIWSKDKTHIKSAKISKQ